MRDRSLQVSQWCVSLEPQLIHREMRLVRLSGGDGSGTCGVGIGTGAFLAEGDDAGFCSPCWCCCSGSVGCAAAWVMVRGRFR